VGEADALPEGLRIGEHLAQLRQTLALLARPTPGAGRTRRSRLVESRIQTQARDQHGGAADRVQPFECGVGVVTDQDDRSLGQPAPELKHHLPCPVEQRLVSSATLPGIPLRGAEGGEERQCPDATGPGNGNEQHERKPTQTAGLYEVAMAATYGIPVDAACLDASAPATFNRVVQGEDQRPLGSKGLDELVKEDLSGTMRRPASTAQHPVVVLEGGGGIQPEHAQGCRDGAATRREQGADDQQDRVPEHTRREQRRKRRQNRTNRTRQSTHQSPRVKRPPRYVLRRAFSGSNGQRKAKGAPTIASPALQRPGAETSAEAAGAQAGASASRAATKPREQAAKEQAR
jgi:hypothetical protein